MPNPTLSAEFAHYLHGYSGTAIQKTGLSEVFAARDMVNNTIFELVRYAKDFVELQVLILQHHETELCEFDFFFKFIKQGMNDRTKKQIYKFLETIQLQFDFLNLQISEKMVEGCKLKLSTFHVGNGVCIPMCEI
jgi:hypothetical protein